MTSEAYCFKYEATDWFPVVVLKVTCFDCGVIKIDYQSSDLNGCGKRAERKVSIVLTKGVQIAFLTCD